MATKQTIKITDLLQISTAVEIDENTQIMVRALSLKEMMSLMLDQTDNFIGLFAEGIKDQLSIESLTPFLISSPRLIARIIATACDAPDAFETVEKNMAATVQLIALQQIWKLSVPDAKKAQELLSGVTVLLQNLARKGQEMRRIPLNTSSPKESLTQ